ncbi:MAG: hypothetical protein U9Q88_01940 [Bacillota bacterium]|jgi:hypothetical protein|uniref:hypothetical protein n=1 Tax=Bacillus sp. RO2 TaxID=2723913 RepID=UPI00145E05E7|nr:hypothetical protein [Bacillus sp. RO2]MEA3318758.1 hypothetical protein [Bacillota bacterium]NMH73458.1 hypothetical protein [Bacillus sp. RO2]
MKKVLSLFLIGLLVVVLAACTSDDKKANEEGFAEETEEREDEESLIPVGETAETEGGSFTYHARNNRLKPIETDSFNINVDKVSVMSGKLAGGFKDYMGQEEIQYIQFDLEVENKTSNSLNFEAYQASIVTNTGEEVAAPDSRLTTKSEDTAELNEKFAGGEKKQGAIFFLLEETKAEDVEWVQINMKAPVDENNEKIGEDIQIKVKL